MTTSLLARFAPTIRDLPVDFANSLPLPASLHLESKSGLDVYYAPFDHVVTTARIVLVGITPGRAQAIEALSVARRELLAGSSLSVAASRAKVAASFAGPMRTNLIQLLDDVGVAARLGIPTTASLWGPDAHLVHFTSALRYPVFASAKNYSGAGITTHPLMRTQLETYFGEECRQLNQALFVPLGSAVEQACDCLVSKGVLQASQVLRGLPHPSGANAERIAYFLGRKPKHMLSAKTRAETLDAGRARALATVAGWHV